MTGTINANETLNGGVEAIPTLSGTLSGNTTSSYNSLSDKPIINGTTLEGGVDRSLVEDVKVNGVSVVTDHVAEIENSAEGISYDNTSSTGVQATNVQDALDEAFQRTMDMSTWFTDIIAENFDYTKTYTVGDYVFYFPSIGVIKLYRCIENTSGAWDSTKWEEVKLSNEVSDEVTLREELESATKVYGTPKNLPQPIATFTDGSNLPMPNLKVSIEPIQDLHGYDAPWVGGAGKNKLQVTATSQTINGVTFTVNDDGTIKVNGTATADARFVIGEYILKAGSSVSLNGSPVDGSTSTIALGYQGYGIVSTANSDKVCDRTSASTDWDNDVYISVTSGYTANNLTFKPMIRLTSVTDETFAPYSNICPISGWTACNVTRSGANLFDKTTITENKIINNNTGEETTSYGRFSSDYIKVNSSTDYYASNVIKSAQWYCAFYYDKNKNYLSCGELSSTGDTASGVITTPSNCNYVRLVGVTTYKDDVSFVAGNQAPTSYEPYNGNTYTIPFTDSQGNPVEVFGGSCDVVNGGGSACKEYDSYNGETLIGPWISDRDVYAPNTSPTIGAQVVDMGDTSTFTSQPTSINSLEGENNVWADCGSIKDLKYVRNLNITINDLISRVEALEG